MVQLMNTGTNPCWISDQQNVAPDSTCIEILPGTPFNWPAQTDLYAITASTTTQTTLAYLINGSQIGTSIAALIQPTANYVAAAQPNTLYKSNYTIVNGIYTITCPTGTITKIDFYDANNNFIMQAVTAAGTIAINLPTTATSFDYWTDTGNNVNISILKTGTNIPFAPAGPLQTFPNSLAQIGVSGDFYALLIQGGQGGQGGNSTTGLSGAGGGTGKIFGGRITLQGNEPLTIGQGTLGGIGANPPIMPAVGTHTILSTLTSANGVGPTVGGVSVGGEVNGLPGAVTPNQTYFPFLPPTTTGSGGSGACTNANDIKIGGSGGVGSTGTGGNGGDTKNGGVNNGSPGTGYGSGGGGGSTNDSFPAIFSNGGNGTPGVLYLIG